MIACLRKFDHVSNTLKELPWLPVEQRILLKIKLICFKVLINLPRSYLKELLCVYEPARCHPLTSGSLLLNPMT